MAVHVLGPAGRDVAMHQLAFEHDGFVTIPGALTSSEVARYRTAVDAVYEREGTVGSPLHRLAFLPDDARFIELLDHRATLPVVRQVLGDNIHCYHCHLDVHPGPEVPRDAWLWHQDGGIVNRDIETSPRPRLSVKVAFFLSDVSGPGRGNLVVLPDHTGPMSSNNPRTGRTPCPVSSPSWRTRATRSSSIGDSGTCGARTGARSRGRCCSWRTPSAGSSRGTTCRSPPRFSRD